MLSFLKLIRFPNLLIIAIAMYAMRCGVIMPMIETMNAELFKNFSDTGTSGLFRITNSHIINVQMNGLDFFLLVLSTVMIAAAGYIINDYFDVRIDRINKPNNVVIDKGVKRRVAMGAHFTISTIAACIVVGLSYKLGKEHEIKMLKYSVIFLLYIAGLWFYSTDFKKQFIIGNLLVSLFVASVPLIVGIYEIPLLVQKHEVLTLPPFEVNFKSIFMTILGFSVLAFIITFVREIIKDIEDMEGDRQYGCRTAPIVLGIDTCKNIVSFMIVIMMIAIGYTQKELYDEKVYLSVGYLFLLVQLPLLYLLYSLMKAQEPKEFKWPDTLCKIIMFTGILYSVMVYIRFN